jgi:hypothetical protein
MRLTPRLAELAVCIAGVVAWWLVHRHVEAALGEAGSLAAGVLYIIVIICGSHYVADSVRKGRR